MAKNLGDVIDSGICPLPAAFIDEKRFFKNCDHYLGLAKQYGKKIRIATKSIRVPEILQMIMERGGAENFSGVMCYSTREALFLAQNCPLPVEDYLIGYPTTSRADYEALWELAFELKKKVHIMVDSIWHCEEVVSFWKEKGRILSLKEFPEIHVCVDIDMSLRLFSGLVHLGVERSPLRTIEQVQLFFAQFLQFQKWSKEEQLPSIPLRLTGLMGYEAQIAGLADANPFLPMLNPIKKWIKKLSLSRVREFRSQIHSLLTTQFPTLAKELELFNGGGTGSFSSTASEEWISEVTVGSGYFHSHLFDYHVVQKILSKGALFIALPLSRKPRPGIFTFLGGGYIASGIPGWDRLPLLVKRDKDEVIKYCPNEAAGEVQTPVRFSGTRDLRNLVIRPAKAGEIAERFNEYYLVTSGDKATVKKVKTYRGWGLSVGY